MALVRGGTNERHRRIQFHHSLSLSITGKKLTASVDKDWSSATKIGFGRKTYTFKGGETKEFDL